MEIFRSGPESSDQTDSDKKNQKREQKKPSKIIFLRLSIMHCSVAS